MGFLRSRPADEDAESEERTADRDPVAIFRADGIEECSIVRSSARLSDQLNSGAPLHVLSAVGAWAAVDSDLVLAIAAPPRAEPSPNRMARRRHVLELTAGPYEITGTVHMPPGADPARYARAAALRWLPMTNATIATQGNTDAFAVDVLLVNLDHVTR